MAQKVPLLYLANDILQNSKRKGNEFVSEFWKVLPSALKDVVEKGSDHGKNVVSRLVISFVTNSDEGLHYAFQTTKNLDQHVLQFLVLFDVMGTFCCIKEIYDILLIFLSD